MFSNLSHRARVCEKTSSKKQNNSASEQRSGKGQVFRGHQEGQKTRTGRVAQREQHEALEVQISMCSNHVGQSRKIPKILGKCSLTTRVLIFSAVGCFFSPETHRGRIDPIEIPSSVIERTIPLAAAIVLIPVEF